MITNIEIIQKDPSKSRYATHKVRFTDDKGNVWDSHCTNNTLALHQLTLKLILQGANESDLEEFGSLHYDQGYESAEEANAS